MDDLKDLDLYNLLGVLQSATIQEVKKAYRKKALSCHPDKNPDNPKAAELFHQLSRALEILIDESARAAYDKLINAKKATLLRNQALDSRRKKLKEDLEARERQAQENASVHKKHEKTAEEKLQAEIERLRKEGSKQVEEEIELVRQEILSERNKLVVGEEESSPLYRLKVRWSSAKADDTNGGYNHENLNKIFSKMNNDEETKVTKSTFTCHSCDKAFTLKWSLQRHFDNVHSPKESLTCNLCDYKTNKKIDLKRHSNKVHQSTSEEKQHEVLTPDIKVTKSTFTCHLCGKAFTLKHSLQVHIDNVHFRKESLKCDMCDYKTNIKGNLKRHRNKVHQNTSEEKQHEIRNIVLKRHIRKCPLCHFYSHTTWKDEINDHFIEIHDIPIKWEKYNFQHIEEFYNWKNKVEIDTKTSFRKYWTSLRSFNFICHRKGFYKTQGTNKRHLKVMGSCKIGGHCPSEIRGEVKANGNITVQYMPTHVGHENELKFLRLKPDDRKIIASHIRYNASHLEVLKEIRNSVSNKELQRIHFVNRQDISNIKRSFNLNAEVKRDPVDPVSITAWVEHFQCSSDTSWTQETHGNTDTTRIKEEISSQKLTNDNMDMNIDESCDQIKDKKTSLSYDQKKFLDKRLKELLKISDVMDSTAKSDRQYGDIIGLVLSHKRKGSALLEFQSSNAAVQAFQLEKGFPSNPLILEWLSGVEPPAMKQFKDTSMFDGVRKLENIVPTKRSLFPSMKQNSDSSANLFPSFSSAPDVFSKQKQSDEDYESIVLKNLRQAEEKKRISEEQDKEES